MTSSKDPRPQAGQRIEATEFVAPGHTFSAAESRIDASTNTGTLTDSVRSPWWQSQFNLMVLVFGLLAVAAGVFIVLTPPPKVASSSTVVDVDGSTRVEKNSVATDVAPWDESRRAQARSDSQDILSELLASKKSLEAKNVKEWADEQFQGALAKAADGDRFYKEQDYVNAIASYQAGLDEMEGLYKLIPDILKSKVADGQDAINAGKTALATEKFQEALRLDKNHIPALSGLDRAKNLDQVLELARAGAADEQKFNRTDDLVDLTLAEQKFQQAATLDSELALVKLGLKRVQDGIADKRFRDAMSQGFNALFKGRYSAARAGFSSALKIRPNDSTARAAYKQSLASDKRSSLSTLLTRAKRLEQNEEWSTALSNYQLVLQRDPNQVAAKLGKIRSQARNELNESLLSLMSDTLDLARGTRREKASKILADARAIKNKGPLLIGQISELEAALKQVSSTVKVAFTSDALTEITLHKAGANKVQLGKFSQKKLALKPGRYVVTGQRLGFHDVRKEIELRAVNSQVQTFAIVCDEPIVNSAASEQVEPILTRRA